MYLYVSRLLTAHSQKGRTRLKIQTLDPLGQAWVRQVNELTYEMTSNGMERDLKHFEMRYILLNLAQLLFNE